MTKYTKEIFIEKANKIHNGKYDYSKVDYKSSKDKVIITCPIHGDFEQEAASHLQGHGCPKCANNDKMTTEEFIKKAKEIHGDKYDYSKVVYVNNSTKVKLICPKHGEFLITPNNHLTLGRGCRKCGFERNSNARKISKEEFIERAKNIHGDNYEYDMSTFKGTQYPIKIKCNNCGTIFEQIVSSHLQGCGCNVCASKKVAEKEKLTIKEFVEKSRKIHQDKYDYSKAKYVNYRTPLELICPKHGSFFQTPDSHLRGSECTECSRIQRGLSNRLTKDEVIKRFKEKHGDIYDYSQVDYKGIDTPIKIRCKKHGYFWQTPYHHMTDNGCPYCRASHLELDVKKLLENNHIEFEYQKRFQWLKSQSLDFYLPQQNIAIECQGEQHFKALDFFGGENALKTTQKRDKKKLHLCKENGVNILYYSYEKYNDDIIIGEDKLLEKIKTNDTGSK